MGYQWTSKASREGGHLMRRTFVISDIHGHQDAFFDLLKQANFTDDDFLYILGDVIDRGPDGISLLRSIMRQPNMYLLLGNHELMMLEVFGVLGKVSDSEELLEMWVQNGGALTYHSFLKLSLPEQQELLDFLEDCPLYEQITLEQGEFLLVHAGIRPLPGLHWEDQLNAQTPRDLLEIRKEFLQSPLTEFPLTIVHGHTPTLMYPRISALSPATRGISIEPNRIGIDCGAAMNAQLGLYCLTDGSCYYVDIPKVES